MGSCSGAANLESPIRGTWVQGKFLVYSVLKLVTVCQVGISDTLSCAEAAIYSLAHGRHLIFSGELVWCGYFERQVYFPLEIIRANATPGWGGDMMRVFLRPIPAVTTAGSAILNPVTLCVDSNTSKPSVCKSIQHEFANFVHIIFSVQKETYMNDAHAGQLKFALSSHPPWSASVMSLVSLFQQLDFFSSSLSGKPFSGYNSYSGVLSINAVHGACPLTTLIAITVLSSPKYNLK